MQKSAKNLVLFEKDSAIVNISFDIAIMKFAINYALSKLLENKDFRNCKNTSEKLLQAIFSNNSDLCSKTYIFSGVSAQIFKNQIKFKKPTT